MTLNGSDMEIDVIIDGKRINIRKEQFSGGLESLADYHFNVTREEIDQAIKKSEK